MICGILQGKEVKNDMQLVHAWIEEKLKRRRRKRRKGGCEQRELQQYFGQQFQNCTLIFVGSPKAVINFFVKSCPVCQLDHRANLIAPLRPILVQPIFGQKIQKMYGRGGGSCQFVDPIYKKIQGGGGGQAKKAIKNVFMIRVRIFFLVYPCHIHILINDKVLY